MQADRPFRMIEVLGSCQIGTVWSAVDVQGRPLTVAVLTASAEAHWRDAFAAAANSLDQPRSGPHFLYADFSAADPWVACPADDGPGAERVFLSLGQQYHPVPPDTGDSPAAIPVPTTVDEPTVDVPAGAISDPESTQPISPIPQPISPGPVQPDSPWTTGDPPTSDRPTSDRPTSGAPVPGPPVSSPPVSGPLPPNGGPRPPGPDPVPPNGLSSDDPFTSPVRRIQPVTRKRRHTGRWLLIVVVLAVLVAGAGAFAWRWTLDDGPPEDDPRPTAAAESAPFPTASPQAPGIEPPRSGAWPAAWPRFAPTDRIRTLTGLDGLGFTVKVPMSWQCVLDGRGTGFARYRCGLAAGDDLQTGGELIVRDCPEQCPRDRQTAMRQAEEAWGLQWIGAGPTAAYAESSTLQIDGAQRYGLVVVAFWRSGSEGAIDRQVVFRMTAPVEGAGQLRRVVNYARDTVIF